MDRKWLSERAYRLKDKDFLDYAEKILPGKSRIGSRLLDIISAERRKSKELEILMIALCNSDVSELTPDMKVLYDKYNHALRLQGVRT